MEIFVGNLPPQVNTSQLIALFQQYGTVIAGRIITDKFSGLSRGFGFVIMPERDEALSAITAVSGKEFHGNKLNAGAALTQSRMRNI